MRGLTHRGLGDGPMVGHSAQSEGHGCNSCPHVSLIVVVHDLPLPCVEPVGGRHLRVSFSLSSVYSLDLIATTESLRLGSYKHSKPKSDIMSLSSWFIQYKYLDYYVHDQKKKSSIYNKVIKWTIMQLTSYTNTSSTLTEAFSILCSESKRRT